METVSWVKSGAVRLIDQTLLPNKLKYIELKTVESVASAIVGMKVRGAPAIGVTAAMGMALAAVKFKGADREKLNSVLDSAAELLASTRPTAVNLFWALARMKSVAAKSGSVENVRKAMVAEAEKIRREDVEACRAIGAFGAKLLKKNSRVLTHCNAGGLATAGYGTALGVIRAARDAGKIERVYVDETRPWLQGAKLTAFELAMEKIPATLICDNMAGALMARGEVDAVVVGADRIAANGDFANKTGTYGLAVLARAHGVPFYVAAPVSTIDMATPDGAGIVIETRDEREIRAFNGVKICPDETEVYNPAFDVAPAELATAIITERGVAKAPNANKLKRLACKR